MTKGRTAWATAEGRGGTVSGDAAPAPPAQRIPLSAQIAAAERELARLRAVYPQPARDLLGQLAGLADVGEHARVAEVDRQTAEMAAIVATLRWLAVNEGAVRAAVASVRGHPAVAAVLAEWPDAQIAAVEPLEAPTP